MQWCATITVLLVYFCAPFQKRFDGRGLTVEVRPHSAAGECGVRRSGDLVLALVCLWRRFLTSASFPWRAASWMVVFVYVTSGKAIVSVAVLAIALCESS